MSAALPLILLPPSEGKAAGGEGPPWAPGTMALDLDERRAMMMAALVRAMRKPKAQRAKLLGVNGPALAAGTDADLAIHSSPTMPAIDRYTGVLYDALDHRSLPPAQRRRLDACVCIISGLWGVVTPADPIPEYRLKMNAVLPRFGKLSGWWREDLSGALGRHAEGRRVWNLLPAEHASAWRPPDGLHQWTVRFLEPRPRGDGLVAVSHWNKFLKGALVRFLVANPRAGLDELEGWEHPSGFRLDRTLTDEQGATTFVSFVKRS